MNDPRIHIYFEVMKNGKATKIWADSLSKISIPFFRDTLKLVTNTGGDDGSCLKKVLPPEKGQTYFTEEEYAGLVDDNIFIVCKAAKIFNQFNKKNSLTIDLSSFQSMIDASNLTKDEKISAYAIYKKKQNIWKSYTHYTTDLARCNYATDLPFQGFMDVMLELCKNMEGTNNLSKFCHLMNSFGEIKSLKYLEHVKL
uniref:Uncharacterized protein n=1 Tax=Ciona savignyi TaxID=51511 RepID=H2YH74_CIOSA